MVAPNEWGNITWIFFHTLAEKVSNDKFLEVRDTLIEIIRGICSHLPCPDCSNHASLILRQAYIKNIQTKEHFIEFLRQFHNIVNIKLKKQQMNLDEVSLIYKQKNMTIVIQQFFSIYRKQSYNPKLLTNSFHLSQYLKILNSKLVSIKHAYNN